jgi:hypothetical protein
MRGDSGLDIPQEDVVEIRVGTPFDRTLRAVVKNHWSGVIEVSSQEHDDAGMAVFWQGRLGWATSRNQGETLGSFLRRLGHVTKDDLDIVQALYEAGNGRKKLGRVMEETGVIPNKVLRRCLSMHVRLAIASLLAPGCSVAAVRVGAFCSEEDILFDVLEILPEWDDRPSAPAGLPIGPKDAVTAVLERLKNIPGHSCSLVSDRQCSIIDTRGLKPADVPGPSVLATTAVTLLENTMHSATWNRLGTIDFASAEGSGGALLVHWLDPDGNYLAAILLDSTGKLGIARHELTAAATSFTKTQENST